MKHSTSLDDFAVLFPIERAVVEHIALVRFGTNPNCPKCIGNAHLFLLRTRRVMSCSQCNYEISVTSGTLLDRSKIPLRTWFYLMLLMSNSSKALSVSFVERHLGLSRMTAFRTLSAIRLHLSRRCEGMIQGGGGQVVQIDETWIPQIKNPLSPNGAGAIVFGIYSQSGIMTKHIPNRSAAVLIREVLAGTHPDSIFVTDQHRSYLGLGRLGFKHISLNHSVAEWSNADGYTTVGIESYWANLKYFLQSANLAPKIAYLDGYLGEHAFRYNCRKAGKCPFREMIASFPAIAKADLPRSFHFGKLSKAVKLSTETYNHDNIF